MQKDLRFPSFFYKQRLNAVGIPMLCGVLLFLLLGKGFSAFAFSAAIVFVVLAFFQKGERGQIFLCAAIGIALSMLVCGAYSLQQNKAKSLSGFSHSAEGTVVLVGEDSFDLALSEFDEKFSLFVLRCEGECPYQMGDRIFVEGEMSNSLSDSDRKDGIFLHCQIIRAEHRGKNLFFSFVGKIRNRLSESFGEGRVGSFLKAILLGDKSDLSDEIKEDFRAASSSHLLAISGLHITQIIGFLLLFLRLVGLSKRASRWILIPLIFVLFFLAGAGISVFRASVMMLFVVASSLFRRRGDSVTALVAAAWLAVFHSPYALMDPSFLFSFSSTFAILVCVAPISEAFLFRLIAEKTGPKKKLVFSAFSIFSAFLIGSAVFVFNFPIQLLFFGSVPLFSPLYSLILIPVFSFCLLLAMLLAVLSFFPFSVPLFPQFCNGVFSLFLDWISAFAAASCPFVEFSSLFSAFLAILVFLFLLIFMIFRTKIVRIYQLYFLLFSFLLVYSFFD